MDTLVLSHSYQPIMRVPWQRAIGLVLSGRVEVLEEYEDRQIRSTRSAFPMPAVIRFIQKVVGFFRRGVKFNRRNVWLRDKGHCQYCARKVSLSEFTFDHVTPKSQGGKTCWENIVVSCLACNGRKEDRTPTQAHMVLKNVPVRPKSLPGSDLSMTWGEGMPSSWKDYLGSVQYWHGTLT